jgi:hypothetical protein
MMDDAPKAAAQDLLVAPSAPAEAAARLQQMQDDPKWREAFLSGAPQARAEFEALTQRIAEAGDQAPGQAVETVDSVTDPHALSREAYAGLIDGLRGQGLPDMAEQYMRDIDAGRRTDRPTAGDGVACRQALDRLTADASWRELYLSGDLATHKLVNTLNRIIAYAGTDDKPLTPQVASALERLGVR